MLWLASTVNVGTETRTPSSFATAEAVGGINCINPRAPEGLTALTSKLLSCRMMPEGERRIRRGAPDYRARASPVRQGDPVAPHAAGDKHRAVGHSGIAGEGGRQGAFGRDRRQLVHARQEHPRALGVAPSDEPGGGPQNLVAGEGQRGILSPAGSCTFAISAAGVWPSAKRGQLPIESCRPGCRFFIFGMRHPAPPPRPFAPASSALSICVMAEWESAQRPEMSLRRCRVVQHAQGYEAGEELGIGSLLVRDLTVPQHNRISGLGVAIMQQLSRQDVPLRPEFRGVGIIANALHQRGGRRIAIGATQRAGTVENQPGVDLQSRGKRRHQLLGLRVVAFGGEAGFRGGVAAPHSGG